MYKLVAVSRRVLRYLYQSIYSIMMLQLVYALSTHPLVKLPWILLLLGGLLVSYIAREMLSNGFILLLPHILYGVVVWFVAPSLDLKVVISLFLFAYFLDGMRYLQSRGILKRLADVPWGCCALGLACIFLGQYIKNRQLEMIGYILPVIAIFIFLFSLYLEGLEEYLKSSRHVSGAPMKQIASVNSLIITCILCIILVVMGLGELFHIDVLFLAFAKSMAKVLGFIFFAIITIAGLIYGFFSGASVDSTVNTGQNTDVIYDASIIANIIQFIFVAGLIFLAVIALYKLFKALIKYLMARHQRANEYAEDISPKSKKSVKVEKVARPDSLIGNSPDIKARRLYKKWVDSYKKKFVPDQLDTSGDIKTAVETIEKDVDENNLAGVTDAYNEVRYGGRMPDSHFLKQMKVYIKGLKASK